jgi:hypothetical protein
MSLACPQCRHRDNYKVKWVRFTRKDRIPGGAADPSEKARFEKLRDYLYRVDKVTCTRCRGFQFPTRSMVFVEDDIRWRLRTIDNDNFGNR